MKALFSHFGRLVVTQAPLAANVRPMVFYHPAMLYKLFDITKVFLDFTLS